MKKHNEFIENLKVGDLIAFRMYENDAKMYSGKVTRIGETRIEVQTKNGQKHFVDKVLVQWVNNIVFWPKFVMCAFKGIDIVEEDEGRVNEESIENEELDEWGIDENEGDR